MDETFVTITERAKLNLQHGESHYREFKSALEGPPKDKKPRKASLVCRDIAEALVAFANADGGDLLIGVEDDRTVSGVPHKSEDIKMMLNAPSSHVYPSQLLPLAASGEVEIDGKTVLYFSVSKGTSRIYQLSDGRCVRRVDRGTEPVSIEVLQFERQEVKSREYETLFRDGAHVSDLDHAEVQFAANTFSKGEGVERYLQQMRLAEFQPGGLRLRTAALLLYATDIAKWHPRSEVRILRVRGTELLPGERYNVAQDVVVTGNVTQLVRTAWERLREFLVLGTEFDQAAKFQTRLSFPEEACRETLVNAIAHRDYSIFNPIEIYVFDDRMEIKSPGPLLSTLRLEDVRQLAGAHESRNALIARSLKEQRVMRELGEGMRRIFTTMELNEYRAPELFSNGHSFTVVLYNRPMFDENQERFLGEFSGFPLSRLQRRIVAAGVGRRPLAKDDIAAALGTKDQDTYQQEVTGLVKAGILVRTPDKGFTVTVPKGSKVPRGEGRKLSTRAQLYPEATGVWVGGIDYTESDDSLRQLFEPFGRVRDIRRGTTAYGSYAVVFMETETAAHEAVDGLFGAQLAGRELVFRPFRSKEQK